MSMLSISFCFLLLTFHLPFVRSCGDILNLSQKSLIYWVVGLPLLLLWEISVSSFFLGSFWLMQRMVKSSVFGLYLTLLGSDSTGRKGLLLAG